MTAFDPTIVEKLIRESESAATANERGQKYEAVLAYIFNCVPGTVVVPNSTSYYGSEQIDIAVAHSGALSGLPAEFLVECKNYTHPVDSKAVGYFLFICLSRGARLAVIAAANGLTGDPDEMTHAHSLAKAASAMGCRLVILTNDDLLGFQTVDDICETVQRRYLTAFATGGIGA